MFGIRKRLVALDVRVSDIKNDIDDLEQGIASLQSTLVNLESVVRELHSQALSAVASQSSATRDLVALEMKNSHSLVVKLNDDAADMARKRHEDLRELASQNHADMHRLVSQNHADSWEADERRALSLGDAVLISIDPKIESLKREVIALVGEKAIEVFRKQSNE